MRSVPTTRSDLGAADPKHVQDVVNALKDGKRALVIYNGDVHKEHEMQGIDSDKVSVQVVPKHRATHLPRLGGAAPPPVAFVEPHVKGGATPLITVHGEDGAVIFSHDAVVKNAEVLRSVLGKDSVAPSVAVVASQLSPLGIAVGAVSANLAGAVPLFVTKEDLPKMLRKVTVKAVFAPSLGRLDAPLPAVVFTEDGSAGKKCNVGKDGILKV